MAIHVKHALVVDDDLVSQRILSLMLKTLGHSYECALDGNKCIEALETGDFDIVFLDIAMPIMSGVDVIKHIRNGLVGNKYIDIPVIVVTANTINFNAENSLMLGFNGCIHKPFNINILRKAIDGIKFSSAPNFLLSCQHAECGA